MTTVELLVTVLKIRSDTLSEQSMLRALHDAAEAIKRLPTESDFAPDQGDCMELAEIAIRTARGMSRKPAVWRRDA